MGLRPWLAHGRQFCNAFLTLLVIKIENSSRIEPRKERGDTKIGMGLIVANGMQHAYCSTGIADGLLHVENVGIDLRS